MPAIVSAYTTTTYSRATDIPSAVWDAWRSDACNANVMLPHAENAKACELAGNYGDNLWIACLSREARGLPTVDFVLSCTSGPLGQYPIFIYTTRRTDEMTSEDVVQKMTSLVHALLRKTLVERVFSVFAPEPITQIFASVWAELTGICLDRNPEYYAANISYCTRASFVTRRDSIFPDVEYDLRPAREADTMAAAELCYGFASESEPFVLSMEAAIIEAGILIRKGQLWVHEIRFSGQAPEIASIVAVTRTSSTVAAITKVYTNPRWRKRGCAERLTRKVTKHLLKTKEKIVLYVAHSNPAAAKVYHRVGFLGLGPEAKPVEGVNRWLELGFDRNQVCLGHW